MVIMFVSKNANLLFGHFLLFDRTAGNTALLLCGLTEVVSTVFINFAFVVN